MKNILVGAELFRVDRQTGITKLSATLRTRLKNIYVVSNSAVFKFSNFTGTFT